MSDKDKKFVVVGGGQAAGQLVETLRKNTSGEITLITEEGLFPYQRPHLSKLYLSGVLEERKLLYRPENFYEKNNIKVITNQRVTTIDRSNKKVKLVNGDCFSYDKLAITTGSRARKLPMPGADAKGVFYLRNINDVDQIRKKIGEVNRVVFIGGGFLCLEAASVLISQGKDVSVFETVNRVMSNVAPQISAFYQELHSERGVKIYTNTQLESITIKNNAVAGVMTKEGKEHPADLVIISIGIQPNEELAKESGIECDNGICVNELAVTSDSDIVSAGDCTNHPNIFLKRRLRLESVHNAVEQAKTAAASMCGKTMPYGQVPWFWSDQYNYRLHMVGIPSENAQTVIRGSVEDGKFSVLFFYDDQLVACHAVNRPADYMNCRKILENNIKLSPDNASKANFDFSKLVPKKAKLAFQNR